MKRLIEQFQKQEDAPAAGSSASFGANHAAKDDNEVLELACCNFFFF